MTIQNQILFLPFGYLGALYETDETLPGQSIDVDLSSSDTYRGKIHIATHTRSPTVFRG
jgi:hypothetical protein